MTPTSTPKSPLDGLLTCGNCGEPMTFDDGPESRYICQPGPNNGWRQCQTPQLHAGRADTLLIGKVLNTVLTEKNISIVLAAANEPQVDEDGPQCSLTGRDVKELKNSPNLLVHATGGVVETRNFLGRFIADIHVHTDTAVVHYSIPLPGDSLLAGMKHQVVDLPPEVLA